MTKLDELRHRSDALHKLLAEDEHGLATWHEAVLNAARRIGEIAEPDRPSVFDLPWRADSRPALGDKVRDSIVTVERYPRTIVSSHESHHWQAMQQIAELHNENRGFNLPAH